MFQYSKYNIKEKDSFHPDDYPKVLSELADINRGIAGLPELHKGDIIISFLKDHSLKNIWLNANPALTELFSTRHFVTTHLESLFESCRINNRFTEEFEEYIRKNVA